MAWIIDQLKKIGRCYRDYTFRQMLDDGPHPYIHRRKTIRQYKDDFAAWVKGLTIDKIIVFLVFAVFVFIVARCQAGTEAP